MNKPVHMPNNQAAKGQFHIIASLTWNKHTTCFSLPLFTPYTYGALIVNLVTIQSKNMTHYGSLRDTEINCYWGQQDLFAEARKTQKFTLESHIEVSISLHLAAGHHDGHGAEPKSNHQSDTSRGFEKQ